MTEDQRVQYEAQGYLQIDDAFDAEELDTVRRAFDQTVENNRLDDLPNQDEIFIHLAEHPTLFPIVHRIMGDDVQVRTLGGKHIGPGGAGQGWHRPVAGVLGVYHPASTVSVQVVFHLDDTPEAGACVAVVPSSHRFKSDLPFPNITYIEDMPHHVSLRAKAGTAIVLQGNLWQARTRNRSNLSQRMLSYTYIHCWMRQALPKLMPHAEAVVASSHNLSQLFGVRAGKMDANWYWGRRIEGSPSSPGLPERRFSKLSLVGKGTSANS